MASSSPPPPPPPLRLAILEADIPQPQARDKYGGYTGVFTSLLETAAASMTPPRELYQLVSIAGYDVVHQLHTYPALEDVDAVLITGSSHHAASDSDPWIVNLVSFARRAIESGTVRVVGTCFGHQIVARAAGAELGRGPRGWEVAVTNVQLTPAGSQIFGLDHMRIHQLHRDIVVAFPAGSVPLASNDVCPVQAMYSPGRYLTVQGHPEFDGEIVSEILFNRRTVGAFDDDLYHDAMSRVSIPHDGVAVARAFLNFIRDG